LKRLVLQSSRMQWEQTYSDHLNPRISLPRVMHASSATASASRAAAEMYESANGQTVTSQQSTLSFIYYYYY